MIADESQTAILTAVYNLGLLFIGHGQRAAGNHRLAVSLPGKCHGTGTAEPLVDRHITDGGDTVYDQSGVDSAEKHITGILSISDHTVTGHIHRTGLHHAGIIRHSSGHGTVECDIAAAGNQAAAGKCAVEYDISTGIDRNGASGIHRNIVGNRKIHRNQQFAVADQPESTFLNRQSLAVQIAVDRQGRAVLHDEFGTGLIVRREIVAVDHDPFIHDRMRKARRIAVELTAGNLNRGVDETIYIRLSHKGELRAAFHIDPGGRVVMVRGIISVNRHFAAKRLQSAVEDQAGSPDRPGRRAEHGIGADHQGRALIHDHIRQNLTGGGQFQNRPFVHLEISRIIPVLGINFGGHGHFTALNRNIAAIAGNLAVDPVNCKNVTALKREQQLRTGILDEIPQLDAGILYRKGAVIFHFSERNVRSGDSGTADFGLVHQHIIDQFAADNDLGLFRTVEIHAERICCDFNISANGIILARLIIEINGRLGSNQIVTGTGSRQIHHQRTAVQSHAGFIDDRTGRHLAVDYLAASPQLQLSITAGTENLLAHRSIRGVVIGNHRIGGPDLAFPRSGAQESHRLIGSDLDDAVIKDIAIYSSHRAVGRRIDGRHIKRDPAGAGNIQRRSRIIRISTVECDASRHLNPYAVVDKRSGNHGVADNSDTLHQSVRRFQSGITGDGQIHDGSAVNVLGYIAGNTGILSVEPPGGDIRIGGGLHQGRSQTVRHGVNTRIHSADDPVPVLHRDINVLIEVRNLPGRVTDHPTIPRIIVRTIRVGVPLDLIGADADHDDFPADPPIAVAVDISDLAVGDILIVVVGDRTFTSHGKRTGSGRTVINVHITGTGNRAVVGQGAVELQVTQIAHGNRTGVHHPPEADVSRNIDRAAVLQVHIFAGAGSRIDIQRSRVHENDLAVRIDHILEPGAGGTGADRQSAGVIQAIREKNRLHRHVDRALVHQIDECRAFRSRHRAAGGNRLTGKGNFSGNFIRQLSKGHDLRDGQFTGVHKDRAQHHIGGINQELALVLHRAGHFHIFIDIEAARSLVHQIALQDAAGSVHVDLAAVGDIAGNRILGLNMERGALRQIDIRGNSQGPQFSGNGYGTTLDIQLLKYETVAVAAEFGFASHIGQADRSFLGSGQIQFRIVGEISEILGTGNQYFRPKFRRTSAGLVQTVDDLIELVSGSAGNAQQRIVLIVERAEEFILGTDHIETGFRNMCCRPAVLITGGAAAGIQYIVLDSDFVRNQIERSSVDRIAGALGMNSLRRDRRRRITIQRQQVGIPADGSFPAITGTPRESRH